MRDLIFWLGILVYISIGLFIYGFIGDDDTDAVLWCCFVWPFILSTIILLKFAGLIIIFGNFIGKKIGGD